MANHPCGESSSDVNDDKIRDDAYEMFKHFFTLSRSGADTQKRQWAANEIEKVTIGDKMLYFWKIFQSDLCEMLRRAALRRFTNERNISAYGFRLNYTIKDTLEPHRSDILKAAVAEPDFERKLRFALLMSSMDKNNGWKELKDLISTDSTDRGTKIIALLIASLEPFFVYSCNVPSSIFDFIDELIFDVHSDSESKRDEALRFLTHLASRTNNLKADIFLKMCMYLPDLLPLVIEMMEAQFHSKDFTHSFCSGMRFLDRVIYEAFVEDNFYDAWGEIEASVDRIARLATNAISYMEGCKCAHVDLHTAAAGLIRLIMSFKRGGLKAISRAFKKSIRVMEEKCGDAVSAGIFSKLRGLFGKGISLDKFDEGLKVLFTASQSEANWTLVDCQLYHPVHPHDVSLSSCVDDVRPDFSLSFTAKLANTLDMEKTGQFVESDPIALYHDHVLWGFVVRLARTQDDEFSLSLRSLGSQVGGTGRNGLSDSDFPALPKLRLIDCDLFLYKRDKEEEPTESDFRFAEDRSLVLAIKFTEEELRQYADDSSLLHLSLRLVVPRSFFSLSSIIDLTPLSTSSTAVVTVEAILRGDKPRKSTMKIKGEISHKKSCCKSMTSSPVYYVYKKAFEKSGQFEILINPSAALPLVTTSMCPHFLRWVIQYVYCLELPLPTKEEYASLSTFDGKLASEPKFFVLFVRQWEQTICRKALAMDRHNSSSSMVQLLSLLILIWLAGDGVFPVAKRVTIGVLADMAHLNARSSLQEWVTEEVLPYVEESGCKREYVNGILSAFQKIRIAILPLTTPALKRQHEIIPLSNSSPFSSWTIFTAYDDDFLEECIEYFLVWTFTIKCKNRHTACDLLGNCLLNYNEFSDPSLIAEAISLIEEFPEVRCKWEKKLIGMLSGMITWAESSGTKGSPCHYSCAVISCFFFREGSLLSSSLSDINALRLLFICSDVIRARADCGAHDSHARAIGTITALITRMAFLLPDRTPDIIYSLITATSGAVEKMLSKGNSVDLVPSHKLYYSCLDSLLASLGTKQFSSLLVKACGDMFKYTEDWMEKAVSLLVLEGYWPKIDNTVTNEIVDQGLRALLDRNNVVRLSARALLKRTLPYYNDDPFNSAKGRNTVRVQGSMEVLLESYSTIVELSPKSLLEQHYDSIMTHFKSGIVTISKIYQSSPNRKETYAAHLFKGLSLLSGACPEKFVSDFQSAIWEVMECNTQFAGDDQIYTDDRCFGCDQERAHIIIRKSCLGIDCGNCTCRRPFWCAACTGGILLADSTLPLQKGRCPMCRACFCALDVHFIKDRN